MYPLASKAAICGLFGYSRQAWYDSNKRLSKLQMQEVFILRLAKELRQDHKRMGAEKLLHLLSPLLKEHQIKYGRDKFYALLGEHGLLVRRRKPGPRATNSNHLFRKYPNLIREIQLFSSGRLWVSDITYSVPGSLRDFIAVTRVHLKSALLQLCLVVQAYKSERQ